MKKIKGLEIDELESLDYNLNKLRAELSRKFNFWTSYEDAIASYEKTRGGKKVGVIFKGALFVVLIPRYVGSLLSSSKLESMIREAEIELIEHYELPGTKVRRFRLQCECERKWYEEELSVIDDELKKQKKNLESSSIGSQTRQEINSLVAEYEEKRKKKQNKCEFYKTCEEKLLAIEEQIKVKKSLEASRQKLEQMREVESESERQVETAKELELYNYYGEILENLSLDLKKVELDKEEQIEELELKAMVSKIKIKN